MPQTHEHIPTNDEAVAQRVQDIRRAVRRARSRIRRVLVLRPSAWLVTVLLGGLVLLGGFDALLRMTTGMRVLLLLALLLGCGLVLVRIIRRAVTTRIYRTDLASRLERAIGQRGQPIVPGLLAVGLQFAKDAERASQSTVAHRDDAIASVTHADTAIDPVSASFRTHSLRQLAQTYTPAIIRDAVDPYPTRRALGVALLTIASLSTFSALAPNTASLATRRLFTPWSDAVWPVRYPVSDSTAVRVHPADTALLLRADTVDRARSVRLQYRVLVPTDPDEDPTHTDITAKDSTRLAIVGNTVTERMLIQDTRDGTAAYETLLDPAKWTATATAGTRNDPARPVLLEYWFITADAQTAPARVLVTPPPRIESATLQLVLPEYARGTAAAFARGAVIDNRRLGEVELVEPVLAGTEVALTLTYSKPVTGWSDWESTLLATDASRERTSTPDADAMDADATLSNHITINGVIERTGEVRLNAVDRFGIPERRPAAVRIAVEPDRASVPAIISPARDEAVLATAMVDVLGEARDDAGLGSLALIAQRLVPRSDSPGAMPEPVGAETTLATGDIGDDPTHSPLSARVSSMLSPRDFGAQAGDTILLHAVSTDRRPGRTEASRSLPRRVLIISAEAFVDQIRRELGGVRNVARTLDEEQARVRTRTAEAAREAAQAAEAQDTNDGSDEADNAIEAAVQDLSGASATQDALTQRLTGQRRRLEELEQRIASNRLEDQALSELLEQASASVQRAEGASQRAAEQARRASESASHSVGSSSDSPEPDAAQAAQAAQRAAREADDQQRAVRDELGQLMERLDQGEDAWLARRSVERLLDEQRSISEQTEQISAQTLGRSSDELTDAERSELSRIAERQRDIAEAARAALDDLDDRSRALAESDQAQSDALATAAQRAREQALSENLQQAAEQVGQNQTGQAGQAQQQAMETLQDVLEELDSVESRRAQELKRQLADLAAAIETLIRTQTREVAALDTVITNGPAGNDAEAALGELANVMIALNRNTVAAVEQANAELEMQASVVAEPLEQASDAQVSAIMELRRSGQSQPERAREFEGVSLSRLEEALAAAQGLLEQAEQDEQRRALEELLAEYRDASERQRALREDTAGYAARELTRRDRAEVRSMSTTQRELGESVASLGERVGEFSRLGMLEFTHELLDDSMRRAADALGAGQADGLVLDEQDQIRELLDSIVAALDPRDDGQSPFNQAESQQNGGGGQGGEAQPPPTLDLAELMLLRSVQDRAARLTRTADETGSAPPVALQRRLSELVVEMLKRLEEEQAPAPAQEGTTP